MTKRRAPPKATTPQRDLWVLGDLIRKCALDVAEQAALRRDALAEDPANLPLVRAVIDFEAALEAYANALKP